MDFKTMYLLAKQNGMVDFFRGDQISRRISVKYPLSTQIAILMDAEKKPEVKAEYEVFRQSVKDSVDSDIAAIEAELNQ